MIILFVGCPTLTFKKKLLCEHDLTLEKALIIASAMEQAAKDTIEIQKHSDTGHPAHSQQH